MSLLNALCIITLIGLITYLIVDIIKTIHYNRKRSLFVNSLRVGDLVVKYEHIDNPFMFESNNVYKVMSIDYGRYSSEKFVKVNNINNSRDMFSIDAKWMYTSGWRFFDPTVDRDLM